MASEEDAEKLKNLLNQYRSIGLEYSSKKKRADGLHLYYLQAFHSQIKADLNI
jgi:hypothetical protein